MAKNLLLEIGLEEMPAHVVWPSIKQLEEKVSKFLTENSLTFESIETFSTPRRLAIRVTNIPDRQEDVQEEVKGPAKKSPKTRKAIGVKQRKDLFVVKV